MSKAIIAIDKSRSFRVYCTVTTDLVQQAADIHRTTPLASAGLGRVLTAAGLMGIMMKDPGDKLTIYFKGDGPAKQILATAYGTGSVKGYIANPDVDLPLTDKGKLDVGGSLGVGELTVIKDLGLKEPYVGTIALVSGEIADDLTAYFFISEQQNSSVALGVKVERDLSIGAAGGMIIQMLPDAEEGAVDALEDDSRDGSHDHGDQPCPGKFRRHDRKRHRGRRASGYICRHAGGIRDTDPGGTGYKLGLRLQQGASRTGAHDHRSQGSRGNNRN